MIKGDKKPWDFNGLHYKNEQRGTGRYSLCQSCNNKTGSWYGEEYVKFVEGFHYLMQKEKPEPGMIMHVEEATFRPLPVLKQIVSMFCSLHQIDENNELFDLLRAFVLDKTARNFPKDRIRIGMYLFGGGTLRQAPITAIVKCQEDGNRIEVLSEIVTYPMGYIMYFDPDKNLKMPCADITEFCDTNFEEECKVQIQLPVYECNIPFPADFRSKSELIKCVEDNRRDR